MKSHWWIAVTVFAVCVAITYLPALSGNIPFPRDLLLRHAAWDTVRQQAAYRGPEMVDLIASFYPFRVFAAGTERQGVLPLWNPYILSGAPFQANAQSAVFYPGNLIFDLLPVPWAWTSALALRMFLAALFMALFVRALGGSLAGCVVAGIIFTSCGFMTVHRWEAMGDGALWLPVICYAVHRLQRKMSLGSAVLAAISFALPVFAGHPETAAHLTLTGSAFAFLLWVFPPDPANRFDTRFAGFFALVGALAVGLAAVQILPTVEWLGELKQNLSVPEPALTRHDGQGFFSRDILTSPSSALIPIPEGASYAGMLALLIGSFSLFHRPRSYALFFAVIAFLGMVIAFSIEPFHWVIQHLPMIKAWKNGRMILIADFGIAAMAGLGTTVLQREIPRAIGMWAFLGVPAVIGLGGIFEVYRATLTAAPFMRGPAASLIFVTAAFALIALRLRGTLKTQHFSLIVCGLAAAEMISFTYGLPGFAKASEIFTPAPVFDFLKNQGPPGTFRIAKTGYPIPANSGMVYGIEMAEGYDLTTERVRRFTESLRENRDDGIFFVADGILQSRDRRLDLLNVKYIAVTRPGEDFDAFSNTPGRFAVVYKEPALAVFENKSVLPRAFAVPRPGVEVISDSSAQMDRLRDAAFDPLHHVVLSSVPREVQGSVQPFSSKVDLVESGVSGVRFRTDTSDWSVLVLSQMAYPGWQARIDGRETPVFAADFALLGIALPAGNHEVRFAFEPRSLKIGAIISLVSLGAIVALFFRGNHGRS